MTGPSCRPLDVCLVGNFRHPHCSEVAWADVLEDLGHRVTRLQEDEQTWPSVEAAAATADLCWYTRTWGIRPFAEGVAALARIAGRGSVTVSVHLDLYWGLARQRSVAGDPFWATQHVFTADGDPTSAERFARAGIDHHWFPPAVHAPHATLGSLRDDYYGRVGFVGSSKRYHPEWRWRRRLTDGLARRYRRDYQRAGDGLTVRLHDLSDWCASVDVIVGDSLMLPGHTRYWSDRYPELLGRAGFLIAPAPPGIDEHWTPGVHFVAYEVGRLDQLFDLVDEWARPDRAEQRDRIAVAAREHTLAHHTYHHRIRGLLDRLAELHPHLRAAGEGELDVTGPRTIRLVAPDGSACADYRVRSVLDNPEARTAGADRVTLDEVWRENTYRLRPEHFAGRQVVDVGANVGGFTGLACAWGATRVIAVEPEPENRRLLEANVAANGWQDRVTVVAAAAGGTAGQQMAMHGTGGGAWAEPADGGAATVTLAELAGDLPDGPAVLKVDCEGCEYETLLAAPHVALDRFERVWVETHAGIGCAPSGDVAVELFGRLVAHLAETHKVETLGRPRVGGQLWALRY